MRKKNKAAAASLSAGLLPGDLLRQFNLIAVYMRGTMHLCLLKLHVFFLEMSCLPSLPVNFIYKLMLFRLYVCMGSKINI